MPTDFVAYRIMSSDPCRFKRNSDDNWNQYRWSQDGHWEFFDNHGELSVRECFLEADFIFANTSTGAINATSPTN